MRRTLPALGALLAAAACTDPTGPSPASSRAPTADPPRPGAADLGAVALALVGLCLLVNGNAWALFAVPVALALAWLRPEVPRLRWWFWWFYPVHLALLVSLRWL